jgi:hypothetical protein
VNDAGPIDTLKKAGRSGLQLQVAPPKPFAGLSGKLREIRMNEQALGHFFAA